MMEAADEFSSDGKEQESPAKSLKFIHKVTLDVLAPPDLVWKLWTDIKSAPLWYGNLQCDQEQLMS